MNAIHHRFRESKEAGVFRCMDGAGANVAGSRLREDDDSSGWMDATANVDKLVLPDA